jgi:erythronate-4-phosphate dehydrogenase
MVGLSIVADENIPGVESLFSTLGAVKLVDGRHLCSQQLSDCDILLVRSVTRVDRHLLQGSRVRFVATATIGVDHLDIDYLNAAGIGWASAPGCNADAVVDYVISACCRLDGVLEQLLAGATVGIVGMGNVGSRLYQRLEQLAINCRGYDPFLHQDQFPVLTDLETVLASDVICLHTPLTDRGPHPSYHLLNEARLQKLRPGTVLINAGRGAVVDNKALKELLGYRDDLRVVLDVWENEPTIDIELLKRVALATPHIAGYSLDGKWAGAERIYRACCEFFQQPICIEQQSSRQTLLMDSAENDNCVAIIKQAVLSIYDIAQDDQRLRGALLQSEKVTEAEPLTGRAFDMLRKNYPVRREFSSCQIVNANTLAEEVVNRLRALGFSC